MNQNKNQSTHTRVFHNAQRQKDQNYIRKFDHGKANGVSENGLSDQCHSRAQHISKSHASASGWTNVANGQSLEIRHMPPPSLALGQLRIEQRLERLENIVLRSNREMVQMLKEVSKCYTASTMNASSSMTTVASNTIRSRRTEKRRERKRITEAMHRLIAAGILPPGTTLKDLPPGFGTRSPTSSKVILQDSGESCQEECDTVSTCITPPNLESCLDGCQFQTREGNSSIIEPVIVESLDCTDIPVIAQASVITEDAVVVNVVEAIDDSIVVGNPSVCETIVEEVKISSVEEDAVEIVIERPKDEAGGKEEEQASSEESQKPDADFNDSKNDEHIQQEIVIESQELIEEDIDENISTEYDEYMREREDECDIKLDAPDTVFSPDKTFKEVFKKGGSGEIHSFVDKGVRWHVTVKEGEVICTHRRIPVEANNVPGSSDSGAAFAGDEVRPLKQLTLQPWMQIESIKYVDIELFTYLKLHNLGTGTTTATHAKLHQLSKTFMNKYRVNHIDSFLYLKVIHWTVLAAMVPMKMEVDALKKMARSKIFDDINKVNKFRAKGVIVRSRFWGLWKKTFKIGHDE